MNLYAVPIIATNVILTGIAIFVFLKNRFSRVNSIFTLFSLSMALWLFGYSGMYLSSDSYNALRWARIGFIGIIFIPVFAYHFIIVFLGLKRKIILPVVYFLAIPSLLLSQTDYIYSGIKKHLWGYYPTAGNVYVAFLLMFAILFTRGVWLLFIYLRKSNGIKREQIKYVCLAFGLGTFGIVDYLIKYPFINVYPFGYICALLFNSLIAFAIVRYHLMDINIALTRAGIFIFVYSFILGIPFWLGYVTKAWFPATALAVLLATAGPFIYTRLRRQAEARLLAEDFRKYGILKRFASTLARMRDIGLEKLLKLIIYRLVKTMEISCGAIYLSDEEANACIAKAAHVLKGREGIAAVDLPQDNALIRFITTHRKEFLLEDVQRLAAEVKPKNTYPADNPTAHNGINYPEVIAQMRQLNARLVIPSFLDKELLGFLVLGEKASGRPYSEADIEVLLALSGQASLAILNALFTVKLRDREKELADASRIVEIGNLASSTGHQLGNVLNNIMNAGYTILDNDPILDTLKNNPQAKASFEKIINVIITNASDGDQIIDEIRSYSRQEGDRQYTLVGLKEALDKTLRMLYIQINKFQNIDISSNIAPEVPPVFASAIGLQNIFVNMFNNAYDSIQEMKEYIKSHPELGMNNYKGRIAVSITCAKGNVNIHLVDNGMGMTVDIAKKLFTPHYTTKASSDKRKEIKLSGGTGIGLYTIRFLVKEYGGTVKLVKTGHLEGAEFLIQIPVPKNGEKEV